MSTGLKSKLLLTSIIIIISIFLISLLKNIAYPLLWNDEAETAMYATRILEYGYPKIHDAKNNLYLLELPDKKLGINKKIDAWTCLPWAQYYLAAIGALPARLSDNIYVKTALLRIPFALIGFFGLIIMLFSVLSCFKRDGVQKLLFIFLFFLLELFSIPLILHLREVRSYAINVFLSACFFHIFIGHSILKKVKPAAYLLSLNIILILLFNNFFLSYFIAAAAVILWGLHGSLKRLGSKSLLVEVSPVFTSLVVIIPLLVFFDTLRISSEFAKYFNFNLKLYYGHLSKFLNFFAKFDFLYIALFLKTLSVGILSRFGVVTTQTKQRLGISNFLTLYFLVYALLIARTPYNIIYERYFIALQPVLTLIILVDAFTILDILSSKGKFDLIKKIYLAGGSILMCSMLFFTAADKTALIKNHIYEISHRYKGPLDFVIPYIKSTYSDTKNLVIATNYEECSYMYYLDCKVTIGYVGNNLEEDMKLRPDIIIPRKRFAYTSKKEIFDSLFKKGGYLKISFPIFDYPVNNIPEIGSGLHHLFKTRLAEKSTECLDIYVREGLASFN